ncbi:MAG: clan AA aspartic protease [Rubrobacteraceae bacterium]
MMIGAVTTDDEAVLAVTVLILSESREARVEAVVDTGFTGHLTLRPETVERLALPVAGSAESVLADGSTIVEDFCLARVVWYGNPRSVRALIADAAPLLGMALLRGSELRVEAEPGGAVVVRPLS